MKRRLGLALGALALPALALTWFLSSFDHVTTRVHIGPQDEARYNPYLAAGRLLVRLGLPVHHVSSVPVLRELPQDGTLLLPAPRPSFTPGAHAHLLGWIQAGGHLIVEADLRPGPDAILDAFGVERIEAPATRAGATPTGPPPPRHTLVEARLPHAPQTMRARLRTDPSLDAPAATVHLASATTTHLVHLPAGRGRITVVNDLAFTRNRAIGAHDHAELLWQIVLLHPDPSAVFVLDAPRKRPLGDWLLTHAWAVLAGGALLLVAWLWRIAVRFGPVAPDPEPDRRRLLDHLRASGRFRWTHGGAQDLAEASRQAALRRVVRLHPELAGAALTMQATRLAELAELRREEVQRLFAPLRPGDAEAFIATIAVCQRIHERLARRA